MEYRSYFIQWPRRLWKWFRKNQDAWILFCGILAVGMLGFEAGFIQGASKNQEPLRIELAPEEITKTTNESVNTSEESRKTVGGTVPDDIKNVSEGACAFVASRNSQLFHASTCAVVKRIKPANKLCFKNISEAEARGLKQGCMK
ncbi:MAG: cobalamin biosynthesis protein [Candidatus Moranbacteria bacterium]|nr:cobalamin biosynthesis protein [Candidatus Moranbacteria bacterium]MBP9801733.1 cobalamin biosynthesis protein [Candidatus Moranbacteria bacterium]